MLEVRAENCTDGSSVNEKVETARKVKLFEGCICMDCFLTSLGDIIFWFFPPFTVEFSPFLPLFRRFRKKCEKGREGKSKENLIIFEPQAF